MIETVRIESIQEFEAWKKSKMRKEWQPSTILFTCKLCRKEISIKGRNFKDFICRPCRKSRTEASKSQEVKVKEVTKRKETLMARYNTAATMCIPGVLEHCQQLFLKKFGVKNPAQSKEVQATIKRNNLEKWGYASTNQVPEIKKKQNEKRIATWTFYRDDIILKKRNTLMNRYNDPFYNNVPKIKQTKKEKYGDENYNNLEQIKKTNLERYGNEFWVKTEVGRQSARSHWVNMSAENRNKQTAKCKNTWAHKTSEDFAIIRKKATKKYGCYYIQTPAGRQIIRDCWARKSIEEKAAQSAKCKNTWARKTPEEMKNIREKSRKNYWFWQSTLTPEERQNLQSRLSKKYNYDLMKFDSSWELAVCVWAKDLGKRVIREPVVLEYMFGNKICHYFPDFEIDGQLVEVKGTHFFKKDGTMQNPFNRAQDGLYEAKHQCGLKHGVQFWSEKEVQPALNYMEEKYGAHWIKLFSVKGT